MAGTYASPGPISERTPLSLKAEAEPELSLKRNAEWLREARGAEEVVGLLEIRRAHHILEGRAVIPRVEQIEGLEIESQLHPLTELELLGNTQVHLKERVAALGTRRK